MSSCFFTNVSGYRLSNSLSCPPGFYCPFVSESNPESYPQFCIPSPTCGFNRLLSQRCTDGIKGAQGLFEPVVCPRGYYCPTPKELYVCPAGSVCPSGTVIPRPCDFLSYCPAGSIRQTPYFGLVLCVVIDLILLVLYIIKSYRFRKLKQSASVLPAKSLSNLDKLGQYFIDSMYGESLKMDFKMKNIFYHRPGGNIILQDVSGTIRSSRMTAIIGPSGAGKTTLMDILGGKLNLTSGELLISGVSIELANYKKIYGHVPQDDIMLPELTVRENVLHSAKIRLPNSWSTPKIESLVDSILAALNLTHVAHSLVGDVTTRGISGGQRKRTNVAIEIAALPLCLCLDEPTSGLDSTSALELVEMLSKMSRLGMTIISVMHQPRIEIFRTFDDVLLLTPSGQVAYFGRSKDCRNYFESLGFEFTQGSNEADVIMDILCGRGVNRKRKMDYDEIAKSWKSYSAKGVKLEQDTVDRNFKIKSREIIQGRGASIFKQTVYCHNLNLLQQYRSIKSLILEVFVGSFAGVLMGGAVSNVLELYLGVVIAPFTPISVAPAFWTIPQFSLMIGLAVALAASPGGVRIFGEEIPVFRRNIESGHSSFAYYFGKTISSFYRIVLAGLHFASVLHYLSAPVIPFWVQVSMITLMYFGVFGLSSFVSMIVKRENSSLLAIIIAMFSAVFCGYGPTLNDARSWNLFFLWLISFNMYGAEAHYSETIKVYDHVYDAKISNLPFGYELNRTIFDFIMMAVIGFAWRILAYIAMLIVNRKRLK